MKFNIGKLIKQIRKNLGMSQEELAHKLHMDQRTLSRIERGEKKLDILEFMSMMELLGLPSENFWLLYLESEEYEGYKIYRHLKRLMGDNLVDEAMDTLTQLEKNSISQKSIMQQYILFAKIALDKEMTHQDAISGLQKAIEMSILDFSSDKIANYHLTHVEINIITEMANRHDDFGDFDKALKILKDLVDNRENFKASEEGKAIFLPPLIFNLCNLLLKAEMYNQSLKYCNLAIEASRKYNNPRILPQAIYNLAKCMKMTGEEKRIYEILLIRAFNCAHALGKSHVAKMIGESGERDFGVTHFWGFAYLD